MVNNECTPCPVGMVKTDVNAQFCSYCPLDTIVNYDGTACLAEDCPQGQAKTRTGVCRIKHLALIRPLTLKD